MVWFWPEPARSVCGAPVYRKGTAVHRCTDFYYERYTGVPQRYTGAPLVVVTLKKKEKNS